MGGYIEPGLPRGDPPRTPPTVCAMFVAVERFGPLLILCKRFQLTVTTFVFTFYIHERRPTLWRFHLGLAEPSVVRVWSVLTRALLPRSCAPLVALPGTTRTDLLRNDSDWPC